MNKLFAVIWSYDRPYIIYLSEEQVREDSLTCQYEENILSLGLLNHMYIHGTGLVYMVVRVR